MSNSVVPIKRYSSLDSALEGCPFEIPDLIRERLVLQDVPYWDFSGIERIGQIVIAHARAAELKRIFSELYAIRFPIERMEHVAVYGWDDLASMTANNTSAFNFRPKIGKEEEISNHALGVAIDINPRLNPFWGRDGVMLPHNGGYDFSIPGTIDSTGKVVEIFKRYDWTWGGNWVSVKDYQHFEKPL